MAEPNGVNQPPTSDSAQWAGPETRLWDLWRQGLRPDVRLFLRETGALTPSQLAAVLRIDQRERWWLGQRVPAMAYLNDHQALQAEPEAAIEVIYGEFLLREELGESPSVDEYLVDYPQYAERLRKPGRTPPRARRRYRRREGVDVPLSFWFFPPHRR